MAEFCVKCFNELNHTHYTESEVWTEIDYCEGCAEWKPCIVDLKPKPMIFRMIDFCINSGRFIIDWLRKWKG